MTKKKHSPRRRKLLPPVQNPPGFFVVDEQAARPLPQYRFATARLDDGKIELTFAIPAETPITSRKTKTGLVSQTYTVYIPYTETVDGNSIVKLRAEQRSRSVEVVKRARQPKGKTLTENYTVFLPYQFELEDGRTVTLARMETRSRTVPAAEPQIDYVPRYMTETFQVSHVKCMGTSGKRLTNAQIKERMLEPKPAILINDDSWLTPYFRELLNPETVLIMTKNTRAVRKKK